MAGGTLYSIFFKLFNDYFNDNVFRDGMIGWENVLKSLDIKSWPSEVAMGWDGKNLGISGLKIPGFRDFRIWDLSA